jgi:hypothetical protein
MSKEIILCCLFLSCCVFHFFFRKRPTLLSADEYTNCYELKSQNDNLLLICFCLDTLTPFFTFLTKTFYHLTTDYIATMDAALQHLTDRRTYLRLARQIVTNRGDNLKRFDDEYRAARLRLLFKLYLTTNRPQHRHKHRRLLLRLGNLNKVI